MIITSFIIMCIVIINYALLNPKGPIHEKYVLNCLEQIIARDFKYFKVINFTSIKALDSAFLITVLTTDDMTSPAFEIQQKLLKRVHLLMKFNVQVVNGNLIGNTETLTYFYVIVVDNLEALIESFDVAKNLQTFNPQALFLVYYSKLEPNFENRAESILDLFWSQFIYNAIVVVPSSLRSLHLYSINYTLKSNQMCLQKTKPISLDVCQNGILPKNKHYQQGTMMRKFSNCTINVIANHIEPFVFNESTGFEIAFLQEVGSLIDVFFDIEISGKDSWGTKENGSWSLGLGKVQKEGYFGIGNFYTTPDYSDDFQSTIPHYVSELVWVVPIADYVPRWRVLGTIFSWYLWLLCAFLIIFFASMFRITSTSRKEYKSFKHLSYDFLTAYQVILASAVYKHPKHDFTRIFFFALAASSIILNSVYTSSLIQVLTKPQRERQVDTLEGIFAQRWNIYGLPVYEDIFKNAQDATSKKIAAMFRVDESIHNCLDRVTKERDAATMGSSFFLKFIMAYADPIVTDDRGKPKIFLLSKKIFQYPLRIVVNNGFPFLDIVNQVIQWMNALGLPLAMAHKYTYFLGRVKVMQEESTFSQDLTLDHLQGAFAILLLGYSAGLACLLMELFISLVTNRFC